MGKENGFKKYPSIKRIGHEQNDGMLENGYLVVKEKEDGANFRATWDEKMIESCLVLETSSTGTRKILIVRSNIVLSM